MKVSDAAALIAPAVRRPAETWADLGAGTGTFTRALASLVGPTGRVVAVERDASALSALRALERRGRGRGDGDAPIVVVAQDFTDPLELPAVPLDGALLANALHFVPAADQAPVLAAIARLLAADGGRLAIVEYEGRSASRWVPYPVSFARFASLVRDAGLVAASVRRIGERRSAFGGVMYAAVAELGGGGADRRR